MPVHKILSVIISLMIPFVMSFSKVIVPSVYHDWAHSIPGWVQDPEIAKAKNYSVFLYQKISPTAPNYISNNRGTEGGVYLRYIVDHYDNFPDVAVFVHANPFDHQPHWLDYVGCINPTASYMNINTIKGFRDTSVWKRIEIWVEQCWRDVLKIVWELEDDIDEFERRVPLTHPIFVSFQCCQQFILSRAMVHRRPKEIWQKLLTIIGEQDVCHKGEPDYEHLFAYKKHPVRVGPEPSDIAEEGENSDHRGYGRHTQGGAMEHLAHVVFGFKDLDMDLNLKEEICSNFLPASVCPGSPCKA